MRLQVALSMPLQVTFAPVQVTDLDTFQRAPKKKKKKKWLGGGSFVVGSHPLMWFLREN